ncbi:LAQU0S02e02784g1_1 [Lachancea quebecensis]|uniref:DNA polymerase n=1 Tax=Lachancea quebecensis TaxID=1654605 RepID=A0A0P1KNI5_9SACH|nr:LAQU0S02e02784g1_1 [Lachancea quebecensis]
MKLFSGLNFLVVPSLEPPRVQFLRALIEKNGGKINESATPGFITLVNDSFVNEFGELTKLELFHSEWDYTDTIWNTISSANDLEAYRLSWITECLKQRRLIRSIDLRVSVLFREDETLASTQKILEEELEAPAEVDTDSETDIGSLDTENHSQEPTSLAKKSAMGPEIERARGERQEDINANLIQFLERLSSRFHRQGDKNRSRSYQLALQSIKKYGKPITSEEEAISLPNIGPSIASKIKMVLEVGSLPGLQLSAERDSLLEYFMNCHGVGSRTARKWADNGAKTFKDALKLFPSDFLWSTLFGWKYYDEWLQRIPRQECAQHLKIIEGALKQVDPHARIVMTGSYRRGAETCGDIDMVLYKQDCDSFDELSRILEAVILKLSEVGYIVCPLNLNEHILHAMRPSIDKVVEAAGLSSYSVTASNGALHKFYFGGKITDEQGTKPVSGGPQLKEADQFMSGSCFERRCRRVDILLSRWTQLGGAMIYFTGNDDFNKSLRLKAIERGWKLSNNGLYQVAKIPGSEDNLLESFSERRILQLLGVPWIPPEQRNVEGYI